ncbi:MAG: DUF1295 domain-containing protein [Robiginitomaculum sp.]|nr:DUF1295 domain-containing protein [Robiginitomaculum sp.]
MINDIILNFAAASVFIAAAVLVLWLTALKIKDVSIIDMFWGAGFGFIALICLALSEAVTPYLILLTALPVFWALRFTVYMVWRNWGHGEDKRYRVIRGNVSESRWPFYALRVVFFNQGLAMLVVAAPLWLAMATAVPYDYELYADVINLPRTSLRHHIPYFYYIFGIAKIGTIIWLIGFLFEAIGDYQLARFLARRKKLGAGVTGEILDTGLWRYTRHPNYFGNALMWWGLWLVACQVPYGWLTIISPIFMTYALIKLTGVAVLEKTMLNNDRRTDYADYMRRTPSFIPWLPKK